MRKLIVSEFITLDGVVEAPGGEPGHRHSGWVADFDHGPIEDYKLAELREAEALLFGRATYEGFSEAWPPRKGAIAERLNTLPKYVVASKLAEPLAWSNSTLLQDDLAAAVTSLKATEGGPILVHGSATLVQGLLAAGLVDELRLMLFPVTVGGGRSIYPQGFQKSIFALTDTQKVGSEVLALHFRKR